MSDPNANGTNGDVGTNPDEEYAETYLAGYAEGARSVLKELLGQASRGHTVGELRFLVQSRLAHLPEEVELRRRRLLAAPQTSPWAPVLPRAGPPRPWGAAPPALRILPGSQVLVREERPRRAVELTLEGAARFSRLLVISPDPPTFSGVPPAKVERFVVAAAPGGATLEAIGGSVRGPLESREGALVYLDAVETIALQDGPETALRFVNWLLTYTRERPNAVVAAVHPRVLAAKDQGLLERAFQVVL